MRERVLALKGNISIRSAPGQGTRIEVTMPAVKTVKTEEHKKLE